jgi:CubicO group peptidase (beta-lactamase class C family)
MTFVKKQSKWAPDHKYQGYLKYVFLVLIFHTFQQYSFAQNPNPSATLDAEILNEMSTRHFPGASTIIVKNGEIVWIESYGYADIANSLPVEDTTVFLLASVSKLFTGTAVMQLYETEIIDLDVDINNYLPWSVDVPNFTNDSITARQLMTHTASINDNWGIMSSFYGYPDPTISLSNCMQNYFPTSGSNYNASDNFLNTAPGSTYDYSNMGSALNGYLVEASTGIPFDDYCDNNLFDQLCMVNTAWHFSDFNPNQVATPHYFQNGNYNAVDHYGFADYPNGQLRSTAMDIGNYMIAFLNGGTLGTNSILSSSSVNEMLSLQIPNIDSVTGLNWHKTKLYHSGGEVMVWGHSGGEQGVSTYLYIDPQNDIGICLLTNGEGEGLYICDALYDHALNMTVNNSIIPDCITPADLNEFGLRKDEIIIYPNPAKGFIRIKTDIIEAAWYNIYNISGQLILSGNVSGPHPYIKLPQLPVGLYVFQLENKSPQLIEIN